MWKSLSVLSVKSSSPIWDIFYFDSIFYGIKKKEYFFVKLDHKEFILASNGFVSLKGIKLEKRRDWALLNNCLFLWQHIFFRTHSAFFDLEMNGWSVRANWTNQDRADQIENRSICTKGPSSRNSRVIEKFTTDRPMRVNTLPLTCKNNVSPTNLECTFTQFKSAFSWKLELTSFNSKIKVLKMN